MLTLKRFQSPTLRRNGKRCSRIESMRSFPIVPPSTSRITRAMLGMYRYSMPTHTSPVRRSRARCRASARSASVVHSGFSTSTAVAGASRATSRSTSMWWKFGVGDHERVDRRAAAAVPAALEQREVTVVEADAVEVAELGERVFAQPRLVADGSHTAVTRESGSRWMLRMCSSPMHPVPITP